MQILRSGWNEFVLRKRKIKVEPLRRFGYKSLRRLWLQGYHLRIGHLLFTQRLKGVFSRSWHCDICGTRLLCRKDGTKSRQSIFEYTSRPLVGHLYNDDGNL
uniref:Uncharacterized protein n=1 Tax=Parascaris equorum TaxID=6256 RepID=A0A914RQ43_PAREQ